MIVGSVSVFHPDLDKFGRLYLFARLLILGIVSADLTVSVSVAERDGGRLTGLAVEPLALELNVGQPVLDFRAQMDVTADVERMAIDRAFGAATRHLRSFHALIAGVVITAGETDAVVQ